MRRSESIDLCLSRYTREGEGALAPLIEVLAMEQLLVPIISASSPESAGEDAALETFRVPTFDSGDIRLLPVFTSQERFFAWSSGRYESVDLIGADLHAVVPPATWVMLNPGDELSIKLEPKYVAALAEVVEEDAEPVEQDFPVSSPSPFLLRDLATLLLRYPEVAEAYCFVDVARDLEGAVGLLAPNLGPSRRFSLVGEIAEVSRQHFGMAGSLEVFDDLHITTSRSWELFSSLAPFYTREDVSADLPVQESAPLTGRLEVEHHTETPDADERPDRSMFYSRKKSLFGRIFG